MKPTYPGHDKTISQKKKIKPKAKHNQPATSSICHRQLSHQTRFNITAARSPGRGVLSMSKHPHVSLHSDTVNGPCKHPFGAWSAPPRYFQNPLLYVGPIKQPRIQVDRLHNSSYDFLRKPATTKQVSM
ncbi:hypothetical protein Dimus_012425 [Dionaea muscipula]